VKSRRLRWAGHLARVGRNEKYIQNFGEETSCKVFGRRRRCILRGWTERMSG
jgi:hypothetical protein